MADISVCPEFMIHRNQQTCPSGDRAENVKMIEIAIKKKKKDHWTCWEERSD